VRIATFERQLFHESSAEIVRLVPAISRLSQLRLDAPNRSLAEDKALHP
jgi:hypothetical protein